MTNSGQSSVHDLLTNITNKETFLKDFFTTNFEAKASTHIYEKSGVYPADITSRFERILK